MGFQSTKRIGPISTGHRQWRDNGHCAWVHGYGRYVQFTFDGEPDERQWVFDFGDFKEEKKWIESQWDHRLLIASDDPELDTFKELHAIGVISLNVMDVTKGWGPGIEGSCKFLFDNIQPRIWEKTNNRVNISRVQIWEHEFNTAIYEPTQIDIHRLNQSLLERR